MLSHTPRRLSIREIISSICNSPPVYKYIQYYCMCVRASEIFDSITCVKYLIQFGDKLAPNGTLFDNIINTPPKWV
jgi:hypothetical protein